MSERPATHAQALQIFEEVRKINERLEHLCSVIIEKLDRNSEQLAKIMMTFMSSVGDVLEDREVREEVELLLESLRDEMGRAPEA